MSTETDQNPTAVPESTTPAQPASDRDDSAVNQALRFLAIISYVLTTLSNIRYNFGHRSPWDHGHHEDVGFTPFSASLLPVILYWVLAVIAQFVYLSRFFDVAPKVLNWQYVMSNLLLLSWSYLFARSHYLLSELIIIVNFLQLLGGYLLFGSYRIRPLPNWLAIHGSVIVAPLIWSHFIVFWNGAVLFGARNLPARLIANCLIWEFLLVPGSLMFMTGDYLLGFASAWITFSVGLGQLFTKVFALQWVFAFTIGTILLVTSLVLAFVRPASNVSPPALTQIRQQTTNSNETAPLLTDP